MSLSKTIAKYRHKIFTTRFLSPLVKSNRINALRKQYDAFLEEDKKRKERNEYILGRLDKMRVCTTIQLRHKPNVLGERRGIISYDPGQDRDDGRQLSHNIQKNLSLDIPRQYDENFILQEISKKYILIPKLRPGLDNNYNRVVAQTIPYSQHEEINPNVSDNTDWKSKYDILKQLKRNEKEQDDIHNENFDQGILKDDNLSGLRKVGADDVKEDLNLDKVASKYNRSEIKSNYDPLLETNIELPEKDSGDTYQAQDNTGYAIKEPSNIYSRETSNIIPENESILNEVSALNTVYDYEQTGENLQYNYAEENEHEPALEYTNNTETVAESEEVIGQIEDPANLYTEDAVFNPITNNDSKNEDNNYPLTHLDPVTYDNQVEDKEEIEDNEKGIYSNEDELSPIQTLSPNEFVREINNEIPPAQESYPDENIEYPVEIINAQEFTPTDDVKLQDGVNINPEGVVMSEGNIDSTPQYEEQPTVVDEHVDNTIDSSGIEAFDAEQREMFYSEQTDETYVYNEANTQGAYNEEYPVQNENYPEGDQYAYYEGAQQEQTFPVEVNEHEETTQRYDPSYEEQYGNTYDQQGYQQQQEYEQQPQQYAEQPEDYSQEPLQLQEGVYDETQQGFEQHYEQNYETQEHIEQQIDSEQGYVENVNEVIGNEANMPSVQETTQNDEVAGQKAS